MLTTRMTRKGQVTIPAEIRDKLHLDEGNVFLVREQDGKVVLESQAVELRRAVAEISALVKHVPPMEPDEFRNVAAKAVAAEWLSSSDDGSSSK